MTGASKSAESDSGRFTYGDSTSFPLADDFIKTLLALTDACVALFKLDIAAESRRAKAAGARDHAEGELARLSSLESWVSDALAVMLPQGTPKNAGETAASRISKSMEQTLTKIRADVSKKRDAAVRVALANRLPPAVRGPVDSFFLHSSLPNTRWSLHWRAGDAQRPPSAIVRGKSEHNVCAEFSTDLSGRSRWSSALQVRDLGLAPVLNLVDPRSGKSRRIRLKKYSVTEIEASPDQQVLTLRTSARRPSPGFHVVLRRGDFVAPVLTPIDELGEATSDSYELKGDAAADVVTLWQTLLAGAPELVALRDTVIALRFDGKALPDLESPAQLAEAMLATVAPLVRQMRIRSRVPGELVLKREVGNGKREEMFVPRDKLQAKFEMLPSRFARVFEAMGLGSETTNEVISRELPLMPRALTETGPVDRASQLHGLNYEHTEPNDRFEHPDSSDDVTHPRARPPTRPRTSEPVAEDGADPLAPVAGTIEAA